MGFVILAASLKYLSNLDQVLHWGFLTRERFLAAWIVLFAMAGLYLLGFLRMEGIKPDEPVGLGRLLHGRGFPDLRHQPAARHVRRQLGELDAFVPARRHGVRRHWRRRQAAGRALAWMKNQYREALGQRPRAKANSSS